MLLGVKQRQSLVPVYDLSLAGDLALKLANLFLQVAITPLEHVGVSVLLSDQLLGLLKALLKLVVLLHEALDYQIENPDLARQSLDRPLVWSLSHRRRS